MVEKIKNEHTFTIKEARGVGTYNALGSRIYVVLRLQHCYQHQFI